MKKNMIYQNNVNYKSYEYFVSDIQGILFDKLPVNPIKNINNYKIYTNSSNINNIDNYCFKIQNRRYIGNKYKLLSWIFSIILNECKGNSFADIFSGTGVIADKACQIYKKIIVNDFLYSNNIIFKAFFQNDKFDNQKIQTIINIYNSVNPENISDNYFSDNFGGKFFSNDDAKKIGFIRENIETNKYNLTDKEYNVLLASLLYSADKAANTVGHFDAYIKKSFIPNSFLLKPIEIKFLNTNITIYRKDSNLLAKEISADITYIDPPYNSRQYSRFYHILENLTKWEKPALHGIALKPNPENMSDYCRVNANLKFSELINNLNSKYIVVSYNNTYNSKSSSSKNKISLEEIKAILETKGQTKIFDKSYRYFTTGNTSFQDHKEYLFVTKVN